MTVRSPFIQTPKVDPSIVSDIKRASQASHVDFGYLMAQAAQESGFHPDAKASTSSATGLYQFLDTTWLHAVKQWGGKHGLGALAAKIDTNAKGGLSVDDPAVKQQILDLRKDPHYAAALAGDLASQNKQDVERNLGRPASATDLYLAHFLGAQGATDFVKKVEHDGTTKAADLLPQAAAANRSVFYETSGEAKTVSEIYRNFSAKIEGQIRQYAHAEGIEQNTAADVVAFRAPIEKPDRNTGPLVAMMNVLALAAMKLVGNPKAPEQSSQEHDKQIEAERHRATTTLS